MIKPGLCLVHKPAGVTSFSLVKAAQAELPEEPGKKRLPLCHGGTLDPFAEGLLLLLAGQATRLFERLHVLPKVYVAEVAWGAETDNGDPTGQVTSRADASALGPAQLEGALQAFLGWTEQVPPPTSAKKIGGEPAYRKVHRGEAVVLPPSRVYLRQARWLHHALPERSTLELVVRGGFYVRALVRDLGRQLGTFAHVVTLRRTAIGPWTDPGPSGEQSQVRGAALVPWLPTLSLSPEIADAVRAWKPISPAPLTSPRWPLPAGFVDEGPSIALTQKERLLALAQPEGGLLVPKLNFWGSL